jgi:hypothetical protein
MNLHKTPRSATRLLATLGVSAVALAVAGDAHSGSSSAGEEFLAAFEAVPPNVMFVLDISDLAEAECGYALDSGESYDSDESFDSCIAYMTTAIDSLTQHYDWAYFGVATTAEAAGDDTFQEVSALGTSHAQLSVDLDALKTAVEARTSTVTTRNLAEALAGLSNSYFSTESTDTTDPWNDGPIDYHCQETHTVTIALGTPQDDNNPAMGGSSTLPSKDVICDAGHNKGSTEVECYYDNVTYALYNTDHNSTHDGDQTVVNHTVGVRINGSSLSEELFGNASDEISNEGIYTVANQGDEILGNLMEVLGYVRQGFFSRSSPVISADGAYMIYAFYEISGENPLAEGHVRAYEVDDDADSSTYGQVLYDGDDQFGGAIWDAGDLLVSRPVIAGETNPDDRDGLGQRDIYTFVPELMALSAATYDVVDEGEEYHRMGLDADFVSAAASSTTLLDKFIDTTNSAYNLDLDADEIIDSDDLQALVDFTRGLPSAKFRYLDEEHGYWKLGDSPHSMPVVVNARNNNYTTDPTYRTFLTELENLSSNPDGVLIAANDGMLHFFRLEDDPTTNSFSSGLGSDEDADEAGEELWAWLPGYILYNTKDDEDWAGRLVDMMWYGRTFLFDGTPVVEDVWIDGYGSNPEDGVKDCDSLPDNCEWRRVVVVQQGKGGPVTLALDITETQDPQFLWEQVNSIDYSANAYTVSRPVIANLYDASDSTEPKDAWAAIWGSGRAVPQATDEDYYLSAEANLYFWRMGDTYWENQNTDYDDQTQSGTWDTEGSNGHPELDDYASSLDSDGDGNYEYGYISGSIAAVDYDGDGDADVIYFPATTSYVPTDEGGSGVGSDVADPGHTWMYKAIIDTTDPDDPEWCEFVDPMDHVGERPEVYYAPTVSFHTDGSLGIYWGTGTPYERSYTSDIGYLFAFKDLTPTTCGTATPIDCAGNDGFYNLDGGEGLTGDPLVYNGVIYFPTYIPDSDLCETGVGRIWALAFDDCEGGMDTDGDGEADAAYIEVEGYPSNLTITEQGTLFYGVSAPDTSKSGGAAVGEITALSDPFMGTLTLGLREIF